MNKFRLKVVVSSLLLLLLLFLATSGALLYFGKTGVVMGFPRNDIRNTHTWAAVLMCVLGLAHLVLNRRQYFSELKSLGKRQRKTRDTDEKAEE